MARPKKITFTETELDLAVTGAVQNAAGLILRNLLESGATPDGNTGKVIMQVSLFNETLKSAFKDLQKDFHNLPAADDEERVELLNRKINGTVRG